MRNYWQFETSFFIVSILVFEQGRFAKMKHLKSKGQAFCELNRARTSTGLVIAQVNALSVASLKVAFSL